MPPWAQQPQDSPRRTSPSRPSAEPRRPIPSWAPRDSTATRSTSWAHHQPVQISQIYSGAVTYAIAGSTTIIPYSTKAAKPVPFYGSISHGLDKQTSILKLLFPGQPYTIPRATFPLSPGPGVFGGNGLGGLINTQFSRVFQGSGAVPPVLAANPTPGTTMKADDRSTTLLTRSTTPSVTRPANPPPRLAASTSSTPPTQPTPSTSSSRCPNSASMATPTT